MAITAREARTIVRKAMRRVPRGEEITHLNITAMMDMMTILLVFLIKSASVQTTTFKDVTIPASTTKQKMAEEAVSVIVTKTSIIVEGVPIVQVRNGDVDSSEKQGGVDGTVIAKLEEELKGHAKRLRTLNTMKGLDTGDEGLELTLISDRTTPFRLLHEVMYTAGKDEYGKFRLVVMRPGGDE